ncbi:hypothetical protein BT63DRAFT_455604 [Microthyrium microscopicum]|uniref:BZIP domain-containing protein n=1 Tax=Microthyrium microscopicum TaxID=703497 RepID=A0A6A6UFH0_9PEZI|nr:hypothetical protein BT63DRAFT_455604 [Microthyrium microscopicum]
MKGKAAREQAPDSRKERRRTTDREAQRASRARTKKRIEELESTIESLLVGQADDRVKSLSDQLEQQRQINKELMASLGNIQKIVSHTFPTEAPSSPNLSGSDEQPGRTYLAEPSPEGQQWPRNFEHLHEAEKIRSQSGSTLAETVILPTNASDPDPPESTVPKIHCVAEIHHSNDPEPILPTPKDTRKNAVQKPHVRLKAWEVVEAAMFQVLEMIRKDDTFDTHFDADIVNRAVLYGWSEVEAMYTLDVGWKFFQQIDQYLFFQCGPVARLAILRSLRNELIRKTHIDKLRDVIPTYMEARPAVNMVEHPVLVDFLVWPDLRDHMLLSPSTYSPNKFAKFFSKSVRFLWSDSLNDIWTMDHNTGQYQFSAMFNDRFQDAHSWALSVDFFVHFPQLIGVVPIYNAIPRSLQYPVSMASLSETPKVVDVSENNLHTMLWNNDFTTSGI